jgi:hypothetical protein
MRNVIGCLTSVFPCSHFLNYFTPNSKIGIHSDVAVCKPGYRKKTYTGLCVGDYTCDDIGFMDCVTGCALNAQECATSLIRTAMAVLTAACKITVMVLSAGTATAATQAAIGIIKVV